MNDAPRPERITKNYGTMIPNLTDLEKIMSLRSQAWESIKKFCYDKTKCSPSAENILRIRI
jgi:hypothetical protein